MPPIKRCLLVPNLLIILLLIGCAPTLKQIPVSKEAIEAEREKQREIALLNFLERQDRLNNIAYPLLIAASPFCKEDLRVLGGFQVHDKKNYKEEDAIIVARHYRLEDQPTVRYIHPKLPAGLAGLKINDKILEINGKHPQNAREVVKIIQDLDPLKEQSIHLLVEREGQTLDLSLSCVLACLYPVQLILHDSVNAWVDTQKRVNVTTGLMRFIQSDEELSLVVGHEIAHLALDHVTKKAGHVVLGSIVDILLAVTTGVDTRGVFGKLGGLLFSKEYEKEADYLGTYLTARAGFDVTNAANIWRRMAAEYPGSIEDVFLASHPSTPERFLCIEETVNEINKKRDRGEPLLPEKKQDKIP